MAKGDKTHGFVEDWANEIAYLMHQHAGTGGWR